MKSCVQPNAMLSQSCEAANDAFRNETHHRLRGKVTRAVMCDTSPPCVTELLFEHEFWIKPGRRGGSRMAVATQRCRNWQRDGDWPTTDPHVTRQPHFKGIWSVLRLLPNRTVWIHGDSLQLQLHSAALCSLLRDGKVATASALSGRGRPAWVNALSATSGLNLFHTELVNGVRLLGSGLGKYEPRGVEQVLAHTDVAIFNFGLHYLERGEMGTMMRSAFAQLAEWRAREPGRRLALWREGSAQHFAGGAYFRGAEKVKPGEPCQCTRSITHRAHEEATNLNVEAVALERQLASGTGVGLVPFFELTAARHDMHRAHFCSYNDQQRVGTCCDCTHLCYTPVFWDAVFAGLREALVAHAASRASQVAHWRTHPSSPALRAVESSLPPLPARGRRRKVAAAAARVAATAVAEADPPTATTIAVPTHAAATAPAFHPKHARASRARRQEGRGHVRRARGRASRAVAASAPEGGRARGRGAAAPRGRVTFAQLQNIRDK